MPLFTSLCYLRLLPSLLLRLLQHDLLVGDRQHLDLLEAVGGGRAGQLDLVLLLAHVLDDDLLAVGRLDHLE